MNWILHHYDFSTFSEKIRLIFGLKGLRWHSVEIPAYLPKPDYTPLTGGYRRTPALQVGADIYCDTRLIAEVLEEASPTPSINPTDTRSQSVGVAISHWAETSLLWPTALFITGVHADRFPRSFHDDRASLHHKAPGDSARVKASAKYFRVQMESGLARIEDLFSDGVPYVLGDAPAVADFSLYPVPWFLDTIEPGHTFLNDKPATRAWMSRIASIGHGERIDMSADDAIAVASSSQPQEIPRAAAEIPEGITLGESVAVSPLDEYSPAMGRLAHADSRRIVIDVENERVGNIRVHFPRVGYRLKRSK